MSQPREDPFCPFCCCSAPTHPSLGSPSFEFCQFSFSHFPLSHGSRLQPSSCTFPPRHPHRRVAFSLAFLTHFSHCHASPTTSPSHPSLVASIQSPHLIHCHFQPLSPSSPQHTQLPQRSRRTLPGLACCHHRHTSHPTHQSPRDLTHHTCLLHIYPVHGHV